MVVSGHPRLRAKRRKGGGEISKFSALRRFCDCFLMCNRDCCHRVCCRPCEMCMKISVGEKPGLAASMDGNRVSHINEQKDSMLPRARGAGRSGAEGRLDLAGTHAQRKRPPGHAAAPRPVRSKKRLGPRLVVCEDSACDGTRGGPSHLNPAPARSRSPAGTRRRGPARRPRPPRGPPPAPPDLPPRPLHSGRAGGAGARGRGPGWRSSSRRRGRRWEPCFRRK